ncbi:HU family DNA-binding protein [Moraxella pluranimalium]|uniref:Integration host factor subunit beta n=1 Tax=Moraxella pluranimalium TaxID=470453 RepID=A0A1T0CVB4_9GAMM|nr:HU family DNA-binding protein [Moraxella pluranimalium]OOS26283.1 integration host factor subunit beta [Moraxella pluranimalium]
MQAQAVINKSDLISNLAANADGLEEHIVDEAVRLILAMMVDELVHDGRIEIRGFGSFCLHHREAREARNPRTGEKVSVGAKAVPFFKPGKALRESVNAIND